MYPVPLCLEKWGGGGHDPPAPMGAPPLMRTTSQSLYRVFNLLKFVHYHHQEEEEVSRAPILMCWDRNVPSIIWEIGTPYLRPYLRHRAIKIGVTHVGERSEESVTPAITGAGNRRPNFLVLCTCAQSHTVREILFLRR